MKRTPLRRKTPLRAKTPLKWGGPLRRKKKMRKVSEKMREIKADLKPLFHEPVKARDGGVCQYHKLFFGSAEVEATVGEHALTQGKWPELRFCLWVGVAGCDCCNLLRNDEVIRTCIVRGAMGCDDEAGPAYVQVAWYVPPQGSKEKPSPFFARLLVGKHVGEWRAVEPDPEWKNDCLYEVESLEAFA